MVFTDFPNLFGLNQSFDFSFEYDVIEGVEKEKLIIDCITRAESSAFSGEHRKSDWHDGWDENLNDLLRTNKLESLKPRYYKKNVSFRLNGEFVRSAEDDIVWQISTFFRSALLRYWLSGVAEIHEFGCGTGHHLAWFASNYPDKQYYGYDWAESSQRILQILNERFGLPIAGRRFDIFKPDTSISFSPHSGVFTFAALEQVGNNYLPFLDFLLERKPDIVVNVEPLYELYDPTRLLDFLAMRYHKNRNYLMGYLSALNNMETEGRIRILKVHRQRFGNLYNETHSYVVWQPLR